MVFRKKKPVPEPVAAVEPADWENDIEDVEQQTAQVKQQTQVLQQQMQQPVAPPQPVQAQPQQTNQQARVRQITIRDDGVYEFVIEANYMIGNVGEII